jgi:hypothetical protein
MGAKHPRAQSHPDHQQISQFGSLEFIEVRQRSKLTDFKTFKLANSNFERQKRSSIQTVAAVVAAVGHFHPRIDRRALLKRQ